jgi:hypothetical protein
MEGYKLRTSESKVFRSISGPKRDEIQMMINSKKTKCVEHIASMEHQRTAYKSSVGKPE